MSNFIQQVADDTIEITKPMSDYIKSLPTTTQWDLWLKLTRPEYAKVYGPFTLFTCICCGLLFNGSPNAYRGPQTKAGRPRNKPYSMRIMARVRVQTEDSTFDKGLYTVTKEWTVRPAVKTGIGCPACMSRFHEAESQTIAYNKHMEHKNTLDAKIAQLSGCKECKQQYNGCTCVDKHGKKVFKPHTFRAASMREPSVMVLEDAKCSKCKDTYHIYTGPKFTDYALCECYVPPPFEEIVRVETKRLEQERLAIPSINTRSLI